MASTEPPGTGQQVVDRAELDLLLHKWADRIARQAANKLRAADPVTFDAVSDTIRELVESTTFAGAIEALQALVGGTDVVDGDRLLAHLRAQEEGR